MLRYGEKSTATNGCVIWYASEWDDMVGQLNRIILGSGDKNQTSGRKQLLRAIDILNKGYMYVDNYVSGDSSREYSIELSPNSSELSPFSSETLVDGMILHFKSSRTSTGAGDYFLSVREMDYTATAPSFIINNKGLKSNGNRLKKNELIAGDIYAVRYYKVHDRFEIVYQLSDVYTGGLKTNKDLTIGLENTNVGKIVKDEATTLYTIDGVKYREANKLNLVKFSMGLSVTYANNTVDTGDINFIKEVNTASPLNGIHLSPSKFGNKGYVVFHGLNETKYSCRIDIEDNSISLEKIISLGKTSNVDIVIYEGAVLYKLTHPTGDKQLFSGIRLNADSGEGFDNTKYLPEIFLSNPLYDGVNGEPYRTTGFIFDSTGVKLSGKYPFIRNPGTIEMSGVVSSTANSITHIIERNGVEVSRGNGFLLGARNVININSDHLLHSKGVNTYDGALRLRNTMIVDPNDVSRLIQDPSPSIDKLKTGIDTVINTSSTNVHKTFNGVLTNTAGFWFTTGNPATDMKIIHETGVSGSIGYGTSIAHFITGNEASTGDGDRVSFHADVPYTTEGYSSVDIFNSGKIVAGTKDKGFLTIVKDKDAGGGAIGLTSDDLGLDWVAGIYFSSNSIDFTRGVNITASKYLVSYGDTLAEVVHYGDLPTFKITIKGDINGQATVDHLSNVEISVVFGEGVVKTEGNQYINGSLSAKNLILYGESGETISESNPYNLIVNKADFHSIESVAVDIRAVLNMNGIMRKNGRDVIGFITAYAHVSVSGFFAGYPTRGFTSATTTDDGRGVRLRFITPHSSVNDYVVIVSNQESYVGDNDAGTTIAWIGRANEYIEVFPMANDNNGSNTWDSAVQLIVIEVKV